MTNARNMETASTPVAPAAGASRTKSRLTLVAVFMAFALPLILASVMYARLDIWKPSTMVNHGQLMDPVAPLAMLSLLDSENRPILLQDLQGVWTLAYVAAGPCQVQCQSELFKIRQARAMLGRDLVRVQTLYIGLDALSIESMQPLLRDYPALKIGTVTESQAAAQRNAFAEDAAGNYFLIDPHGNLVLRYDADSTTRGVLKDLKRLLKVSQIG